MPLLKLPTEVLRSIFSYLRRRELAAVSRTRRGFRAWLRTSGNTLYRLIAALQSTGKSRTFAVYGPGGKACRAVVSQDTLICTIDGGLATASVPRIAVDASVAAVQLAKLKSQSLEALDGGLLSDDHEFYSWTPDGILCGVRGEPINTPATDDFHHFAHPVTRTHCIEFSFFEQNFVVVSVTTRLPQPRRTTEFHVTVPPQQALELSIDANQSSVFCLVFGKAENRVVHSCTLEQVDLLSGRRTSVEIVWDLPTPHMCHVTLVALRDNSAYLLDVSCGSFRIVAINCTSRRPELVRSFSGVVWFSVVREGDVLLFTAHGITLVDIASGEILAKRRTADELGFEWESVFWGEGMEVSPPSLGETCQHIERFGRHPVCVRTATSAEAPALQIVTWDKGSKLLLLDG
eukprot:TRINITY_DN16251_c0_g1_i1.p1 TRINITY_DN16251_c0_g1~~TRINITY_DN16251_c0_g1_i1.p1  ORF type:complete len:404 (-),score=53.02 TRINITY_DN16251_c0_g1_i1:110-1321(-)